MFPVPLHVCSSVILVQSQPLLHLYRCVHTGAGGPGIQVASISELSSPHTQIVLKDGCWSSTSRSRSPPSIKITKLAPDIHPNDGIEPEHLSKSRNWTRTFIQIKESTSGIHPNQGIGPGHPSKSSGCPGIQSPLHVTAFSLVTPLCCNLLPRVSQLCIQATGFSLIVRPNVYTKKKQVGN